MKREVFLKTLGVGTLGIAGTGIGLNYHAKKYKRADFNNLKVGWQNWSELQKCNPASIETPTNEEALIEIMGKAKTVRFAGTGHSFMPLIPTDQTIVSLDAFSGIISKDDTNLTARVKAGSKLAYLAREFNDKGQAFMNLPDINTQSLAGAMNTGTHGTGREFMAMHAYVKALKLITPKGEEFECSATENPEIFQAAKVSIGSLGIITEYTIQNRNAYALHRVGTFRSLEWVLKNGPAEFDKHDHYELYYLAHTGMCYTIQHNVHTGPLKPKEKSEDEDYLSTFKSVRDYLFWAPSIRQSLMKQFLEDGKVEEDFSDDAWRLLSQARVSKFNESEYHVPKENAFACFKKVCDTIDSMKNTYYPVEFRIIKKDDAWLSPFQQDTMSIAIHASYDEEYQYLIKDFGPIYRSFGGRPHWGKLNDFTKEEFKKAYPRWDDFLAVRQKCDPENKLLNDYLKKIFV